MNQTEMEAGETICTVGKYKGEKFWWILDENPAYFKWLVKTFKPEDDWTFAADLQMYAKAKKDKWKNA